MKDILKWIAWVLLVLPVSFLLGLIAGCGAQAWNALMLKVLKLD